MIRYLNSVLFAKDEVERRWVVEVERGMVDLWLFVSGAIAIRVEEETIYRVAVSRQKGQADVRLVHLLMN